MIPLMALFIVLALAGCATAAEDVAVELEARDIGNRIERDSDTLRQIERMIEEDKYFSCVKLQRDGISGGCVKPWLVKPEPQPEAPASP